MSKRQANFAAEDMIFPHPAKYGYKQIANTVSPA